MSRMYSGSKGKSGSKKPIKKTQPTWLNYKPKEVELLVLKLAKEGQTTSKIGLHLRDNYGIPDVKLITGKSISKIIAEKNLSPQLPEDIFALIKKAIKIKKHLEENDQDNAALRGLQLTQSKINRLTKYYKEQNKLPVDWKFDIKKARLYSE